MHFFSNRYNGCISKKALLVVALLLLGLGTGCAPADSGSGRGAGGGAQLELPTARPPVEPSPVNTRVMSLESLTPAPTGTITPIPDEVPGLVVEVLDGDTIVVVLDGDPMRLAYEVRYTGIEAPPRSADDPWGVVAYETNRRLTNLKVVRLVRDETDFDEEGYMLRYVYLDDQLVNTLLVEQGLAQAAIEAPDTRFESEIEAAEAEARAQDLGIWSGQTPTPTPGGRPTRAATPTAEAATDEPDAAATATDSPTRTPSPTTTQTGTVTSTPSGEADETTATPTADDATATRTPTVSPTPTAGTPSSTDLEGPS